MKLHLTESIQLYFICVDEEDLIKIFFLNKFKQIIKNEGNISPGICLSFQLYLATVQLGSWERTEDDAS